MINPELLTDDLAKQVAKEAIDTHIVSSAEEFICSCCACTAVDIYARRMAHIVKEALSEDEEQKHAELFKALFESLAPYEKQYKAMLETVWEKERRIVVANIKKMKKAWLHKDKIDDLLYPVGQFEKELSENALKINITIVDAQGNVAMNELAAVDVMFDVSNPEVQNWLNSYTPKFSKALEKVSTDKLRRELTEGIGAGEGIPELLKRVNGTYANWNRVRSEAIARTETMRAANQGSINAYKQSGVVRAKVWITHFDNRTCASCKRLNNKVISLEKNFFNQGDPSEVIVSDGRRQTFSNDYEDISAPPRHTLCRCTVAASFKEAPEVPEEEWKPTMTRGEAEKWSKKSKIKYDIYHGTAAKKQIMRTGFMDEFIGSNTGNSGFYGKGHYFARVKEHAQMYGRKGDFLTAKINVTKPCSWKEFKRLSAKHNFDDIIGKSVMKGPAKVTKILKGYGYDSVIQGTRLIEQEIVIFDAKNITIITGG